MIFVSTSVPVNPAGEFPVTRDQLWDGLVAKARNALPFVAAMSSCEVVIEHPDGSFDRRVELRGQALTERVRFEEPHRVVFTRLDGPVLGTIANEIEGADDELRLRFSFALVIAGLEGGSAEEKAYADGMTGDYLAAVSSTVDAVRRVARGDRA